MPYHLAILHTVGPWGEGEGLEERAVQGRGDIASKQQGSPFRTDYNKLATLIETNGKLSALFACNALPIKVGERFRLLLRKTPTNQRTLVPLRPVFRGDHFARFDPFPDPIHPITYLYKWDGW